jgi:hypothetical protein
LLSSHDRAFGSLALKIAYFVHDLSDAAVHRRIRMLTAGGAAVAPIGFRRSAAAIDTVEGMLAIDLGRTGDGKLARRVVSVARVLAKLGVLAQHVRGAKAILARNLETLVLAASARKRYAPKARLVYECLDIHRMLLSDRLEGKLMRLLESRLWREVDLLLTSSPAFIQNYFAPRNFASPIQLVENKVLMLGDQWPRILPACRRGPPWRIGWFGVIRCSRSLDILAAVARGANGAVEVIIKGRPTELVFPDFASRVANLPYVQFDGPYCSADLPTIYRDVHFCWAIDYYEPGQNSAWLLPNRLYEGNLNGTVPIALRGVETGHWLTKRGVGIVLEEPLEQNILAALTGLSMDRYVELAAKVHALPHTEVVADETDCRNLVRAVCLS